MRKIRKIAYAAMTAALLALNVLAVSGDAYAYADIETLQEKEEPYVLHVTLDRPADFGESVEVYIDGSAYYLLKSCGYAADYSISEGQHEIKVLSSSNISKEFRFEYQEQINVTSNMDYSIKAVRDGDAVVADDEEMAYEILPEDMDPDLYTSEMPDPQVFDFSDSGEYGTIMISRRSYAAVKDAVFCLVGNGKMYEIHLTQDALGRAEVKLPPGSYYESTSIDVTLDQDAAKPDDLAFLWRHSGDSDFFGKYYEVKAGETLSIDDLIIKMVMEGEAMDFNSNALYAPKLISNLEQAKESHIQEELESAFPERYTTAETEPVTIPEAEIVTEVDDKPMIGEVVGGVLIAVAIMVMVFAAVAIKKRKRS